MVVVLDEKFGNGVPEVKEVPSYGASTSFFLLGMYYICKVVHNNTNSLETYASEIVFIL